MNISLSEYTKIFRVNDNIYACYNSLRMIPVYLTADEYTKLQTALTDGTAPDILESTLESLRKCRIFSHDDDAYLIQRVRDTMPKPYPCIAYFVLTEQCNLACKYCFLGNGEKSPDSISMSNDTAERALIFFAEQTRRKPELFDENKNIIFYGGEPLINFGTLRFIVQKCREMQKNKLITTNLDFMMVTNGLLMNPENISFLRDNNISVSVSLDGATERANSLRIDRSGSAVHSRVLEKIRLAVSMGLQLSLSVTLTESALNDMDELISLLQDVPIKSLCFNILHRTAHFHVEDDYYIRAAEFIAKFYRKTKSIGIYEERFMRKLKSFAGQKIYFADCAACSGNQIVIMPSGAVGICQGCSEEGRYMIADINNPDHDISSDDTVREWSRLGPVFRDECRHCEALGLCGGMCPLNTDDIHATDESFCAYSKYMLEFLIKELYSMMK